MRLWLPMLGSLLLLAVGSGASAGTSDGPQNGSIAVRGDRGISLIDTRTSSIKLLPGTVNATGATAWSPDGRRLAFEAWAKDDLGLYSVKADGTDLRLVLRNASWPSWSPDGKQLAVVREGDESSNLFTVDADGHNLRQLTFEVDGVVGAAWSPDGKWIAFVDADGVNRVKPDGSGRLLLESDEAAQNLAWSPDGKWIAFVGSDGIYRMRPDGSERERLSRDEVATHLSFSPDGSRVVFDRVSGKASAMEIAVLDVGSRKRLDAALRRAPGFAPTWSPDGRQLAFSVSRPEPVQVGGCGGHGGGNVWVMNADGKYPRLVAKGEYGPVAWGAAVPGVTVEPRSDAG